jgi:hypothetical protein
MSEYRPIEGKEGDFPVKNENRGNFAVLKLVEDEMGWAPGIIAKTTNKATSDSEGYSVPSVESFKNAWEKDMRGLEEYFSEYLLPYKTDYKITNTYADNYVDVEQTMYIPEVVEEDFGNLNQEQKNKILKELDQFFGSCTIMFRNYDKSNIVRRIPDISLPNLMYGFNINEPGKKQWFIIDTQPALVAIFSDNTKSRMVKSIGGIMQRYDPENKFNFKNAQELIKLIKNYK